ncbi:hypothetical protein B0J14DRAFT_674835 [Halenospora varia]|nr:hypothetical protein B0J14DRAFT_674835 [Halenospora varia]
MRGTNKSPGIGRGVALSYAAAGCKRIFLGDVNVSGMEETKRRIESQGSGADVQLCHVDISDGTSVECLVASCVAAFGRLDYAINVAGVVPGRAPIVDVDVATFDRTHEINLVGTWLCHRAEIRQMLKQEPLPGGGKIRGNIVSVSSVSGINASPGTSAYTATKHGIIGLCKTDAQEYGPKGIRVNVVCPGIIDTDLFRQTATPGMAEKMVAITPIQMLGQPEDIGSVMTWLSRPESAFLCGAPIVVDGGLTLHRY